MTVKEELRALVSSLDDAAADELLEYAQWLAQPEDVLTDEERPRVEAGEAELQRGDYVTLEEIRHHLGQ